MNYLAGFSGATLDNYRYLLKIFFEWCAQHELDPLDATRAHLELYMRYCEHERKNHMSTIHAKVGVLMGYYDFANEDGLIEKNPARRVRRPAYYRDEASIIGLDRTEITAMIKAAEAESGSVHALIVLMAILGLRLSEATGVRIEDFGEIERSHTVLRLVGKGNKAATIPLPAPVLRALMRAKGDRTHGVLCLRESNGLPYTGAAVRKAVRRLAKQCGITKPARPHLLRHGMVTSALDAGVPLRDVQTAARHSDPRTTMRYDRARLNLDRHASYMVAGYLMGGA